MTFIKIIVLSTVLVVLGGTTLAIAQPDNVVAAPFKGIAVKVLEASADVIGSVEDVQTVTATYERSIVSTSLHAMMIIEQLDSIPAVTVSTNDMDDFPSSKYPLYPDYLEKRHTQFKYTVNSRGEVNVDPSEATTDSMLSEILEKIAQLKEEE